MRRKKIQLSYKKLFTCFIVFLLALGFFSSFLIISKAESTEDYFHTYFCDGTNSKAYEGSNVSYAAFNGNENEFTSSEYNDVGDNNFHVKDETSSSNEYQYHRFEFLIDETINEITKIEIIWKGEAGSDLKSYPPKTKINYSFFVKENENYIKKESRASFDTIIITYESKSLIKKIIESNSIYFGVQSDYSYEQSNLFPSYVDTYFVMLNVTYSNVVEDDELQINAPSSVSENNSFQITVTSDEEVIEGVMVNFSDSVYYTDVNGIAEIMALEVNIDSVFLITAYKTGYISDEVYITIVDDYVPSENPQINIFSPSSVIENDIFQVLITSNNIPIEDVLITFNDDFYYTSTDGTVDIVAPEVDNNQLFSLSASKSGFISRQIYINIIDQSNTFISLISPNGGEVLSNTCEIGWNIINQPERDSFITLEYKLGENSWVSFVDNIDVTTSSYLWDTTDLTDADNYKLRIILTYGQDSVQDISDSYFSIKNQVSNTAWISGMVIEKTQSEMLPLKNASVCIFISEDENEIKTKCKLTDDNGFFNFSTSPGIYNIEAFKSGFNKQKEFEIIANSNEETEQYFLLEKKSKQEENSAVDYLIQEEIKKDSIIASVDFTNQRNQINLYQDPDVSIISSDILSEEGINIVFSGDGQSNSKIVFYLDNIDNPDLINVYYDNEEINKNTDIISFFDSESDKKEWILTSDVSTDSIYVVIVNIPSFSQHSISIYFDSELVSEPISKLPNIIVYLSIIIVSAIAISTHFKRIWKK